MKKLHKSHRRRLKVANRLRRERANLNQLNQANNRRARDELRQAM